ncbi:MAG TPA: NlpC/P60 family protein [Brevundimonas sp.]|uniref:C40 family peptidase n=1 Tax=Brevundimonas sp. TaxID=1871086 RepID=UPI002E0F140D|nr:NlpC/P60 family protein [Brevundimonas sp.]
MTALSALDPETTLILDGVAALELEGILPARAYQPVVPMQGCVAVAPVRERPEDDGRQRDQLIFGEIFDVLHEADGWCFGRGRRDGVVGWVEAPALSAPVLLATHRVSALRTYVYAEADPHSQPVMLLSLNALVTVRGETGDFLEVERAGFIARSHLADLHAFETDPAEVAERFVGAPWQAGGRESLGLDDAGLVQQALYACGLGCPRRADDQARSLGVAVSAAEARRGDLVFWNGRAGVLVDAGRVAHASLEALAVRIAPLVEVAAGAEPAFRRP